MTLEIERDTLLGALRAVVDVVATRNTLPVLSNVLLEAGSGELVVTATDLDLQASVRVEAAGELRVTVEASKLVAAADSLKPGSIVMALGDNGRVTLKQSRAQRTLPVINADDFPKRRPLEKPVAFRMPAASLARLFDATTPAIASDETRYYLNGVFLHVVDCNLVAAASDGHRMIRAQAALPAGADLLPAAIIPAKTVGYLRKLLAKADGEIHVMVTAEAIGVDIGNSHILSKLIDGTYPDYQRIIPEEAANRLVLARDSLIEAVNAVAAVVNAEGDKIKIRSVAFDLKPEAEASEVRSKDNTGALAVEPIDCEYSGAPILFGMNHRYMVAVASIFAESGKLTLSLADPKAPVRITSDKDPDVLAIVMPMRA